MATECAVEGSVAQRRIQRVGVVIKMQNQMLVGKASARRGRSLSAVDQDSLNVLSSPSKLEPKRYLLSIDCRSAYPGAGRTLRCRLRERTETQCEGNAKQQPEASELHGQSFGCSIGSTFDAGGRLPRSTTIREWRLEKTQQQGWKFRPGTAIGCRQRQAALWSNSMDSTLTQRTGRRNPIVSDGLTKTVAKLHDR